MRIVQAVLGALYGGNPAAVPGLPDLPPPPPPPPPKPLPRASETASLPASPPPKPPEIKKSFGQATTEVVLLLPLFMFFLFGFAKVFAILVLVQKMEIASYYAARRWQLESHRNVQYEPFDDGLLCNDIERRVEEYLGFANPRTRAFLGLSDVKVCPVTRTQVWNVVTLTVRVNPIRTPVLKFNLPAFEVVKYVPNRDRPIAFVLPGLQP